MPAQRQAASSLSLPEMAQRMVDAATAITTGQMRLSEPAQVKAMLARDEPDAVARFRRELSRQIAAAILWMDPHVIEVYEDGDEHRATLTEPLRIIVRVDSETAALRTLFSGLSAALGQIQIEGISTPTGLRVDPLIVDQRNARLLRNDLGRFPDGPRLLASRDQVAAAGIRD